LNSNDIPESVWVILIENSSKTIGKKYVIFSGNGGQMRHRTSGRLYICLWVYKISFGKPKEKGPLVELGVDERITLKRKLNK
jgi:hypothetical protein